MADVQRSLFSNLYCVEGLFVAELYRTQMRQSGKLFAPGNGRLVVGTGITANPYMRVL
jgi:hypothetical protein